MQLGHMMAKVFSGDAGWAGSSSCSRKKWAARWRTIGAGRRTASARGCVCRTAGVAPPGSPGVAG